MNIYNQKSHLKTIFHDFATLEEGACLAGYSALIEAHDLKVPTPDYLCSIGNKHKKYAHGHWRMFTPRHKPENTLYGHLAFALKYEGIDLAVLNVLFQIIRAGELEAIIRSEPTGIYSSLKN